MRLKISVIEENILFPPFVIEGAQTIEKQELSDAARRASSDSAIILLGVSACKQSLMFYWGQDIWI